MIEKLLRMLGIFPKERLVPVEEPARTLDDTELVAAFAVAEDNPLWIAVNQLLREQLEQARVQTCSPQLADRPGAMTHCAGGLEWLSCLQADLHDHFRKANGRYGPQPSERVTAKPGKAEKPATTGKAVMPDSQPGEQTAPKPTPAPPRKDGQPTDDELLAEGGD